jgi:hypothetical protein
MRLSGRPAARVGVALVSSVALLTAAPAAADWHRVDTPNFVVVGEEGARSLSEIAARFEAFRETLTRLLGERTTATPVPTVVIVFPSDRAFTAFKPQFRGKPVALGGLFVPGQDVNYIAIVDGGSGAALRMIFHEYAHLVFANAVRSMPLWLNEGLAEYYSTFELGRDRTQATIGRPIGDHLETLKRSPRFRIEALLRIDHGSPAYNEGNRRSIFYAQAWALTHLILHGEPRRTHLLEAYLGLLRDGVPGVDAWRRTFGGEDMERELVLYLKRNVFKGHRFTFPDTLAAFEPVPVPLTAPDVEAFLADLLLQQQRPDEAAERLATVPGGDETAWVSTVQALLDIARKDLPSADFRLSRLEDRQDWLTSYRAGVGLSTLASDDVDGPQEARLEAARRLFAAARAARAEMPHAVASLARMELAQDGPPSGDTQAALERASRAAPGRYDYVFLRARMLARQSAFIAARHLLAPLMSAVHPRDVRDVARRLMGDIVQVETAGVQAAWARREGRVGWSTQPGAAHGPDHHEPSEDQVLASFVAAPSLETVCER